MEYSKYSAASASRDTKFGQPAETGRTLHVPRLPVEIFTCRCSRSPNGFTYSRGKGNEWVPCTPYSALCIQSLSNYIIVWCTRSASSATEHATCRALRIRADRIFDVGPMDSLFNFLGRERGRIVPGLSRLALTPLDPHEHIQDSVWTCRTLPLNPPSRYSVLQVHTVVTPSLVSSTVIYLTPRSDSP